MIPFGPFAPDAGATAKGVCLEADGVLPKEAGYGPMAGPSVPVDAGALPDDVRGISSLVLNDGTWAEYGFTADSVYPLGADFTWGAAIATGFTCTSGDDWSVAHYGVKMLYTNTTDGLQSYDVEAGSADSAISDAGDPRFIFVANNQVVALDCKDSNGDRDNRLIRVSAYGNQTEWKQNGADYQSLADGGGLVAGGSVGGNASIVLQQRAARLMQFGAVSTSSGSTFGIQNISTEIGCVGARSFVLGDQSAFWLATDGFCSFSLGGGLKRIGAGRIDQWFMSVTDQGALPTVQGAADPLNKIVWWRFKRQGAASDTVFYDLLGYSWQWDRWVTAQVTTTALTRAATPGYTVEDYDALVDDTDLPVDDRFWQGGQPLFGVLNGDLKVAFFAGSPLAATLETSVSNSPVTGLIGWCTPICDAADLTVELGVSDALSDDLTWKTAASKGRAGRVPLRGRGMNIAFRLNIPAGSDWTDAKGIDHIVAASGGVK